MVQQDFRFKDHALAAIIISIGTGPALAGNNQPTDLNSCYTHVALTKSTADVMYLAKGICDELFKPRPRAIVILDPKTGKCTERWFDSNGRYESSDLYCAFENGGSGKNWTYACETKSRKNDSFSLVELKETDEGYLRVGKTTGKDPGAIFKGMAACIRFKASKQR